MRGYHPLLAVAAGTGEVLHSRLRRGQAQTVWGAASFLAETVSRLREAGASGELTLRADAGFQRYCPNCTAAIKRMRSRRGHGWAKAKGS